MIKRHVLGLMLIAAPIAACGSGGKNNGGNGGNSNPGSGGKITAGSGGNSNPGSGGKNTAGSGGNNNGVGGKDGTGGGSDAGAPPSACGSQPFQPPTGGRSFYMAPTGSDSAAGTMAAPFKTMKKAASVAKGGDIVYLRDGVYNQSEDFTPTGSAGNPVVFMAMPGEHPILDGTGLGLGTSDSVLQLYLPQHVVVAGLEIRNSGGRGLQLIDANDVVIRDSTIHDVQSKGLGLNGNNVVAEGNVIYNAVLNNANSDGSGGWSEAIATQLLQNGSSSTNITVRGNLVHDVWGECIDALFANGMTITGNEVRDCYSVGIYVDTSNSVRIEGNIVRASNQTYQKNGHLMDGILLVAEAYDMTVPNYGADNVVIANNVVLGVHNGIGWWDDTGNTKPSNSYVNVQVAFNVVWGSQQNALMFTKVPSGGAAPSGTLLNNILYGSGSTSLNIGDIGAWTITNNDFPNGKPSSASDASNVAVDPMLTGTPAASAAPTVFQLGASSPCRHAGRPVAAVPLDFTCATRGLTNTTIGAFE